MRVSLLSRSGGTPFPSDRQFSTLPSVMREPPAPPPPQAGGGVVLGGGGKQQVHILVRERNARSLKIFCLKFFKKNCTDKNFANKKITDKTIFVDKKNYPRQVEAWECQGTFLGSSSSLWSSPKLFVEGLHFMVRWFSQVLRCVAKDPGAGGGSAPG